jgi:SAM-dependent methyltransferase
LKTEYVIQIIHVDFFEGVQAKQLWLLGLPVLSVCGLFELEGWPIMQDDVTDIRGYYDADAKQEADRLIRHPIKFEITMRYLMKYLPKSGTILDVGCGPGSYAVPLAQSGYDVAGVDFSAELVQMCNSLSSDKCVADRIRTHIADARDLKFLPDETFDAGMLMGPLYHLFHREERQQAIQQVASKLKPGAPFFSAHISRIGILPHIALRAPEWIADHASVQSVMEVGHDGPTHPRAGGFRGYFATIEELPPLHEEMGIETLVIAASDPASVAVDSMFRQLSIEQQDLWLELLFAVSAEPSFRGAWPHLLYIGNKRI